MQHELPLFAAKDHLFTVSELTHEIKDLLESNYSQINLTGEISNFHSHSSGHFYFTLKDELSQIQAVMFRGANRNLKFEVEDGLQVTSQGRVSVYEPRGNYQIIIETMEPKGLGALQLAFEQLKEKLLKEGLFDPELKKPLPFLPQNIGLITSPTGAAVQDMIRILHRRNPKVNILINPVQVQGEGAAKSIAQAIADMNEYAELDVLIVGRGGGSLEDLWAFNEEIVARAIAASKLPVVSAVGHEVDFTISDFVADLRAATPSAAAELVVPIYKELLEQIQDKQFQIQQKIRQILEQKHSQLKFWQSHLKHPKKRLEETAQHLDDLSTRLELAQKNQMRDYRQKLIHLTEKLQVLSPLAILARGYSITHLMDAQGKIGEVLKNKTQTQTGHLLSIQLWKGNIKAKVV